MTENTITILVVDDDRYALALASRYLKRAGYNVITASDGVEAMHVLLEDGPPLVVTDWNMPNMNGLELCRAIRSHEGIDYTFIVMLTGADDKDGVLQALDAGVDDYLTKPFDQRELLARVRAGVRLIDLQQDLARRRREVHRINAELEITHTRLADANEKLRLASITDELTRLANRREAMSRLQAMWQTSEQEHKPFACVMVDIDHFKLFNDKHGHAVGDEVLRRTARILERNAGKDQLVCRLGGEEFLILCPNTTAEAAKTDAERIRAAMETASFTSEGKELHATISLGVAERIPGMPSPDDLLQAADTALYDAKHAGRNRVCTASQPDEDVVQLPANTQDAANATARETGTPRVRFVCRE